MGTPDTARCICGSSVSIKATQNKKQNKKQRVFCKFDRLRMFTRMPGDSGLYCGVRVAFFDRYLIFVADFTD